MRHKLALIALCLVYACKPNSNSQELLNISRTDLMEGFEFLSDIDLDICFPDTDVFLDDFEPFTDNSNSVSSVTDFEFFSILNELDQVKIPCVGNIDISAVVQSGISFESIDPNPQVALADVLTMGQRGLRVLKQLRRIKIGKVNPSSAPKTIFLQRSGARIQSVAVRALPKGQQFLSQQKKVFNDSGEVAKGRLWRYFKGQKVANRPRASFGEVLNPLRSERPDPRSIKFGQASVSDSFGDGVRGGGVSKSDPFREMYDDWEVGGRKLSDVINDLRHGKLNSRDFPIEVFKYKDKVGNIHWITLNNRSLTVLRGAGVQPSNIKVITAEELASKKGADNILPVLNRLVSMPNELPSTSTYIRIKGLNSRGELRESWNWDAPFGYRVGN